MVLRAVSSAFGIGQLKVVYMHSMQLKVVKKS